MSIPWGTSVSAVRSRPRGRVALDFVPGGWEVRACPVSWADLRVWYWWSLGGSLVLAWIGTIPVLVFDLPKTVGFPFALPGALLLGGLLVYGVAEAIIEFFKYVLEVFGLFTRKGRRRFFGRSDSRPRAADMVASAPPPVLQPDAAPVAAQGYRSPSMIPAQAVVGAQVRHRWRRIVITLRMVDGAELRYSRFGMRRPRRTLEANFAAVLGPRLVTQSA